VAAGGAVESDLDSEGAEGLDRVAEALGETFGRGGQAGHAEGAEECQEFGGWAGPGWVVLEEEADGLEDGVGDAGFGGRTEGGQEGVFGGGEGGCRGQYPGGGVSQTGGGAEVDGIHAAEGGAGGSAEGGEEGGVCGMEVAPEVGLGAAAVWGNGGHIDDEGAVSEVGGRAVAGEAGRGGGDGEEDGALEGELEGFALVPGFAEREAGAGGEAAEGVGDGLRDCGDVIEGQEAAVVGQGEELAWGGGQRGQGRGGGVEEGAEDAGGEGFAGAGRALEDEDGVRAGGGEGGEKPDEAAEPVLVTGEVEEGAEWGEVRGGVLGGGGEGEVAAALAEAEVGSGNDFPALRGDVNHFALLVSEVEEDGGRGSWLGFGGCGDAPLDRAEGAAAVGAGFDGVEGLAEGAVGGRELELAVEAVEEPVAEASGTDGPDLVAGTEGEADAGLAVGGGEGDGGRGAVEEELDLGRLDGLVGGCRVT
jgi:hypothetical protein